MLKKTLLSLAIAASAVSLVACNDAETVAEPTEAEMTTEPMVEPEPMVETEPMEEPEVIADPEVTTEESTATQNIVELASDNNDLTILTAALEASGLDQTLMDSGSEFTVFAPTDAAFADALTKLDVTKEELLADKDMLTNVLSYHVIPSMIVKSADIPYGTDIETVNGQAFSISEANIITDASGNTSNITQPDVMATNGVVHVIDTVLMPK
ncbi:fasciclin domain-containing protein [Psychrobacter sp. FBL11]|uniref:Fasciclin domain-containing protein n=1 Tax=Psychrobacter saeujeotis TaxID=3143436 RepID=A0ABU9XAC0_9GAMM|nr:fasciclin domain-containing protein [uncultured Psychrobacter sp.]